MRTLEFEWTLKEESTARGEHSHLLWVEYLAEDGYAPALNQVWVHKRRGASGGSLWDPFLERKIPTRWISDLLWYQLSQAIEADWARQQTLEQEVIDGKIRASEVF